MNTKYGLSLEERLSQDQEREIAAWIASGRRVARGLGMSPYCGLCSGGCSECEACYGWYFDQLYRVEIVGLCQSLEDAIKSVDVES